jgi:hypothetical protein
MHFQNETLDSLQKFQARLNVLPDPLGIESTPDKKATTLVISHVEMTLDEMFFGHWRTENFQWSAIANEVQGSLELVCLHPITGFEIRRVGAASIVITVDKVPDEIKDDLRERNRWALNADNKKPNALDLAFPKLKTECLKNAALSLGKLFGRDLNRRNKDEYRPFKFKVTADNMKQLPPTTFDKLKLAIENSQDEFEVRQAIDALQEVMSDEQRQFLQNLLEQNYGNK